MAHKYFVGGVHPQTMDTELSQAFEPYGLVAEAFCVRRGGVGRGFGFVTFSEAPSAEVMSAPIVINGSKVTVKQAVGQSEMQEAPVSNVTSSRPAEAFKYFIGGLPPDCRTETLESHMNSYGAVKDCVVLTTTDGRSRGFGFVTFETAPLSALLSGSVAVMGQIVSVKESIPQEDFTQRKIFVGGLQPEVDETQLSTMFCQYGPISSTQIIRNRDTQASRGFGFVVFDSEHACRQALARFPGEYNGKPISIKPVEPKSGKGKGGHGNSGGSFGYQGSSVMTYGDPVPTSYAQNVFGNRTGQMGGQIQEQGVVYGQGAFPRAPMQSIYSSPKMGIPHMGARYRPY
jgi:heterogeneous nuclear ribonucleoprotein A1/A3